MGVIGEEGRGEEGSISDRDGGGGGRLVCDHMASKLFKSNKGKELRWGPRGRWWLIYVYRLTHR